MLQREKISDKNATLSCIQTENAAVDFFRCARTLGFFIKARASSDIFAGSGRTAAVAKLMPCGPFLKMRVSNGILCSAKAEAKSSVFITGTHVSSEVWQRYAGGVCGPT